MLVLSCKKQEEINIGDDITIVVLRIGGRRGNRVVLGIEAPKGIKIQRGELPERSQDEEVLS